MTMNGDALKAIREVRKMSRSDLERISGISAETIRTIEESKGNPRFSTLLLLSDSLHVPLDILCSCNLDMYNIDMSEKDNPKLYFNHEESSVLARLVAYLQLQNAFRK